MNINQSINENIENLILVFLSIFSGLAALMSADIARNL